MDRPNSSYGGMSRVSALRNSRSPPRNGGGFRAGSGSIGPRQGAQPDAGKPPSPLRSRVATGARNSNNNEDIEEELYERHRQGELRRQIAEKERELDTMSYKNKDRFNRHLNSNESQYSGGAGASATEQSFMKRTGSVQGTINYTAAQGYSRQRGSNSPLRGQGSRDNSAVAPYSTGHARSGSANASRFQPEVGSGQAYRIVGSNLLAKGPSSRPPIPQAPQHDNYVGGVARQRSPESPSSLRKKRGSQGVGSRSPTRDVDMRDAAYGLLTNPDPRYARKNQPSPVRTASNEYLSQLIQDNNSLQKRLNLVLQELDRVKRDRSGLVQKVNILDQDVSAMQRQLNEEDGADRINGDLQLDLNEKRDRNVDVKRSIADTDLTRTDCIQKLRLLQQDRDRRTHMVEELKEDLHKKIALSKQLEQEQYVATQQVQDLEAQLNDLNRAALRDSNQIEDTKRITDKLTQERDDLHFKLQGLNRTYDTCVQEISRERSQMEGHNRHHNKLLVAKVTFGLLEQMFQRRKQDAMNEFFQYCKFDLKCHNTLKVFVKTIERLGQFKLKIAIKQWHQRTFKPIEMRHQEKDLCHAFMRKKLLTKMFNLWRNRQQNADSIYGSKNKALQAIWQAKVKDVGKDIQRAFTMWRDKAKFARFRDQRTKKMIWRSYSNKLARAWQTWVNYSKTMDAQVRLHVLARTFAENQLKRVTFAEMKFVLFDMRRKRMQRLRTYVKAWREAIQYNKFMVAANMTVLGFKKDCNKSLLKSCFDALRISKEQEKFMLMSEALESDCQPAIESLNKQIEQKTNEVVRSGRTRSLDTIKNMVYRQVAECFTKWKNVNSRRNVKVNDNIKAMIIRRWQQQMRDAFDLWRKGKAHQEISMQEMTICEMQEEGAQLKNDVESLDKEIKTVTKEVDRCARKSLTRGTKIMEKRYLKQYLDKWAQVNRHTSKQQDGSEEILNKIKKRMFRQAFDLYKAGCARQKLAERNEDSCDHLKNALDSKLKRRCFNAIKAFNDKNLKAKRYWKILLGKMDHWMKKRAYSIWMDGGNAMKMEILTDQQNQLTEELEVRNHEAGILTKKVADKNQRNAKLTENLNKIGQRSMANCFARAYYKRTARAFETWREWKRATEHQKQLLKRTMEHWLKQNGKFLMAVFANWKAIARINETKGTIAQLEYEMNDSSLVQDGQNLDFNKEKAALEDATRTANSEFEKTLAKRTKVMALMTEYNQGNHFQGRLRYIFLQWAAHTKRQRHFTDCIKRVVLKSMWERGFQNIREFSRDKQLTRGQNKSLKTIRSMFWRRNCAAAFSKWRQTEYENGLEMIQMTEEAEMQMTQEHMQRKNVIQTQNVTRSARILGKLQKQKFLKAWRNVTRWLKHKRVSTTELLEAQSSYAVKRCIKKWRARKDTTVAARGAYEKFQLKRELLYKKAILREFMQKHHRDKALILRLSNAAAKYDNRGLISAFQMIKNFAKSKEDVFKKDQGHASRNIGDILQKVYRRRLLQHYSHLRRQIHGHKIVEAKKRAMFGHFISASVRDAFNRWKTQANFESTVIEVNEIGPVVEEVLDQRLDVTNLKNLMKDEGFTPYQVDDVANAAEKRSNELLAKSVARWKHWNGTDDYLKPKMFDRWRQYIQMRKIVKHWLDFITNRQQHQKADLSYCFNKWKYCFADQEKALQKKTLDQLKKRAIRAARRLEVLADGTQQDEDMITHLSDQNEELFNNYRKSQRLALGLGRDNHRTGMMRAFAKMLAGTQEDARAQLRYTLQGNIGAIAALKDKMVELENDNEALANENEELRQFSLDGYQLGKNVQNLTQERECLSVDLADKAKTIKKLLDENERLSMRLRQIQDQVGAH